MWNQQKALEVMQSYLASYPKIDAVWASDDDMALGAEKAIKEAGRMNQMWILGGAGMKDIVKRVMDKDPIYPADITYPPAMIAAGIDIAVAHLKDGNIAAAVGQDPGASRHNKRATGAGRNATGPEEGHDRCLYDHSRERQASSTFPTRCSKINRDRDELR